MIVIGVTGGVGTGKSTVSKMLSRLGAVVIDADELAHQAILPGRPGYRALVERFGNGILAPDGTVDRRELGRLAFADSRGAESVNALIHPHVLAAIRRRLAEIAAEGVAVAVLDVPLLFESGCEELCDQVWTVTASEGARRRRLALREGGDAPDVLARERWQMPIEEKIVRSDAVIDNSGDPQETAAQVRRLWDRRWA